MSRMGEAAAAPEKTQEPNKRSGLFAFNLAMTIRYKLFSAIGAIAVLAVIASGVGVYSFSHIRDSFKELATNDLSAMADASGLAIQSNRVSTAAVELSKASEEFDRSSAYGDLVSVVGLLEKEVGRYVKQRSGKDGAADLVSTVASLKQSLGQLDESTKARLRARMRKTDNLAELFTEHEEISRAFVPIIEQSYSKTVAASKDTGEFGGPSSSGAVTGDLAKLKAALEADSTIHRLVAMLVRGALTDDLEQIAPIQEKINALAAKFTKDVEAVGDPNVAAKVYVVAAFADPESGLLPARRDELDAASKSAEIIQEMFFLSDQLSGSIDSMVSSRRKGAEASAENVNATMTYGQLIMAGVGLASLVLVSLIAYFVIHRGLTLRLERLIRYMKTVASGDVETEFPPSVSQDEIGDMARAVDIFRDNARDRMRLEGEQEREQASRAERQKKVETLISGFRTQVGELLTTVSSNMDEMRSTAHVLTGLADEAQGKAGEATSATDNANKNVQAVASAAEELSASISEIGRQVEQASEVTDEANTSVAQTTKKVSGLANAADKIGDIVTIIQGIAEQTNLLALNATIEAARAGDAGKGFAVVASEVKTLANQTGKATEEISSQIAEIQTSTEDAVVAIDTISATMEKVSEYTQAIASAITEQGAATGEISHNVQEAAASSGATSENVQELSATVLETTQSAAQVENASESVAAQAGKLQQTVDTFLKEVAAA